MQKIEDKNMTKDKKGKKRQDALKGKMEIVYNTERVEARR